MSDIQYYKNFRGELFNLHTIPSVTLDTGHSTTRYHVMADGAVMEDFYTDSARCHIFLSWLWGKMQTEELLGNFAITTRIAADAPCLLRFM